MYWSLKVSGFYSDSVFIYRVFLLQALCKIIVTFKSFFWFALLSCRPAAVGWFSVQVKRINFLEPVKAKAKNWLNGGNSYFQPILWRLWRHMLFVVALLFRETCIEFKNTIDLIQLSIFFHSKEHLVWLVGYSIKVAHWTERDVKVWSNLHAGRLVAVLQ